MDLLTLLQVLFSSYPVSTASLQNGSCPQETHAFLQQSGNSTTFSLFNSESVCGSIAHTVTRRPESAAQSSSVLAYWDAWGKKCPLSSPHVSPHVRGSHSLVLRHPEGQS